LKLIRNAWTIALLCLGVSGFAQSEFEEELGVWYGLNTSHRISDNFSINTVAQVRTYELASELERFTVLIGGRYQISERVNVAGGYRYFKVDPSYLGDSPPDFDEHRIFEEVNLNSNLGKVRFDHRLQMEHRFFDFETGSDADSWIRYRIKLSHPLASGWTIDVWDEFFVLLGEPMFPFNWLGTGISYKPCAPVTLRLGYFATIREARDFGRMQLDISWKFDWRKKETE